TNAGATLGGHPPRSAKGPERAPSKGPDGDEDNGDDDDNDDDGACTDEGCDRQGEHTHDIDEPDWGERQALVLARSRYVATREARQSAHALVDALATLRRDMERAWSKGALVQPEAMAEVEARARAFVRAGCCCKWEPAAVPLSGSLRALIAQLGADKPQEPTSGFVALLDALTAAVRLVLASGSAGDLRSLDDAPSGTWTPPDVTPTNAESPVSTKSGEGQENGPTPPKVSPIVAAAPEDRGDSPVRCRSHGSGSESDARAALLPALPSVSSPSDHHSV
ncbi:MAG TPA: hypothetical protein VIO38_16185, partial [Rariglobus sp.]